MDNRNPPDPPPHHLSLGKVTELELRDDFFMVKGGTFPKNDLVIVYRVMSGIYL